MTAPLFLRHEIAARACEIVHCPLRGEIFVATSPGFAPGQPGIIHVLSADDLQPVRQITLPRRAFALALDSAGGRLVVGHTLDGALTVVDADRGTVQHTIQLGRAGAEGRPEHSRKITLDPDRDLAFVTSPSGLGLVWVVDLARGVIRHRIDSAGPWRAGGAYDATRGLFYAGGAGAEPVTLWDIDSAEKCGAFRLPAPQGGNPAEMPHFLINLVLDRAGGRLFATDARQGVLHAFDLASGAQIGQAEIGLGALDLVHDPRADLLHVTYRGDSRDRQTGSGGLVTVAAQDMTVQRQRAIPPHPNSIALAPDGRTAWLTVKAPYAQSHPLWRADAPDSVLRLMLDDPPVAGRAAGH